VLIWIKLLNQTERISLLAGLVLFQALRILWLDQAIHLSKKSPKQPAVSRSSQLPCRWFTPGPALNTGGAFFDHNQDNAMYGMAISMASMVRVIAMRFYLVGVLPQTF
tara:strand:- start:190 stop:513 length:324 start_codon:yes stop_codon:yes gene_type:complete